MLSPALWADVWATYSQYDASFADRRTYGFNVDIANGFATILPTLILYASFTAEFLPAYVAGTVGLMLFWQWTYMTTVYWVSFFVANRQHSVSRRDLCLYILGMNAPWILCPGRTLRFLSIDRGRQLQRPGVAPVERPDYARLNRQPYMMRP